ncbi:MAG TPA: Mur ligase family protein, partial [Flavisolibacter sp.]|nr:Mur ligase family protein [Flavisolibacter sp.]
FYSKGAKVSGYDKTQTELTRELEAAGMAVHYKEDVNAIPKDLDLVVYTPAVPADHAELVYLKEHGYNVVKRSDVLGMISAASFNICVGGTHGKTTITTMTAHILRHSGYGSTAFLGGISVNYNTNFWSSKMDVCVIEADEYDRSFLKLSPDIAVITAMDADHLDIYGDEQSMQDAFVAFGNKVKKDGLLVSRFGLKRIKEITVKRKMSFSLRNDAADIFADEIRMEEGGYRYNAVINGEVLSNLELRIGGMHNVENSLVAIAIASELGITPDKIREAVAAFKGVRRRFEYIIPPQKQEAGGYVMPVLVDDYAHHPEELKALLTSVRSLFPQRLVTVVFQPHLFTRTRDLADGFAAALSLADTVILLPIYPARELPLEGVESGLIAKKIEGSKTLVLSKEGLIDWMKAHRKELNKEFGEVIVMAGAGDIDVLVQPVKEIIQGKL